LFEDGPLDGGHHLYGLSVQDVGARSRHAGERRGDDTPDHRVTDHPRTAAILRVTGKELHKPGCMRGRGVGPSGFPCAVHLLFRPQRA